MMALLDLKASTVGDRDSRWLILSYLAQTGIHVLFSQ